MQSCLNEHVLLNYRTTFSQLSSIFVWLHNASVRMPRQVSETWAQKTSGGGGFQPILPSFKKKKKKFKSLNPTYCYPQILKNLPKQPSVNIFFILIGHPYSA